MSEEEAAAAASRAKLPLFRGTGKDTLTTLAWCEAVDRQKGQLGWNEERTASRAVDCFREEAAEWYRVVREEKPTECKEWKDFRPLIVSRFGVTKSPAQRVAMISGLQQRNTESVESFYDRVAGAYYEVMRQPLEALVGPNKDEKIVGFKTARDELLKLTYVAGMRQNIREQVEARMEATSTLKWIKEAAAAVEVASSRKKTAYAAALAGEPVGGAAHVLATSTGLTAAEIQALIRNEVSNYGGGGAGQKAKASSQGTNKGQISAYTTVDPDAPRQPLATDATRKLGPMAVRGWIYCHRCGQWGMHIRAECKLSVNQMRALAKGDANAKPSGTLKDAQYPNC